MYREIGTFARRMLTQKSLWKDGEIWTAALVGVAAYFWFRKDPAMIEKMRHHFGDLLTTISIVFGFVLTALLFYIQAASLWAKDDNIGRIADKIVDWHVWTIVCMLGLDRIHAWSMVPGRIPQSSFAPVFWSARVSRLPSSLLRISNPRPHLDRLVVISQAKSPPQEVAATTLPKFVPSGVPAVTTLSLFLNHRQKSWASRTLLFQPFHNILQQNLFRSGKMLTRMIETW